MSFKKVFLLASGLKLNGVLYRYYRNKENCNTVLFVDAKNIGLTQIFLEGICRI